MAHDGNVQITFIIVAPPDQVEEGDRIFRSHAPWMQSTHQRDGDNALLEYTVSKAPEVSNPMDPSSALTGNTCFILNEIYQTEAGVADHFQQAMSSWQDFPALGAWLEKCKVTAVSGAPIFSSLW
tara:strand:+ start:267 stop:641 length:375 start_codon:yes stop_codon:yes gene_type:complete